jgi:hypothetical protein
MVPDTISPAYTRNNPTTLTDPSGEGTLDWVQKMYSYFHFCGWGDDNDAYRPPEPIPTPQSLAAEVPGSVKAAIMDSVNASNAPSAGAGDKTGGFHEEGGMWGTDTSGNAVPIPAAPGKVADPRKENATIDPTISANPSLKNNLVSIDGAWHVHPSGTITEGNKTFFFNQHPSNPQDTSRANFPINIVVGAGNKRVYFYNGSGEIGKGMTLKAFMRR